MASSTGPSVGGGVSVRCQAGTKRDREWLDRRGEFDVSVDRFMKQRAVTVVVEGHYTLSNWYDPEGKLRSFACRTTRVSPYRMTVEVPVTGKVGDRLTSYFRDFGQLDGHISDTRHGLFLFELEMPYERRQKLANKLNWLEEKLRDPELPELRRDPRIIPAQPHSTLTLADGSMHPCFVIDVSLSGAAVSSELQLEIGTPLAIGACVGRVVRQFPQGFAVQFVDRQRPVDLERLVARPLAPSFAAIDAEETPVAVPVPVEA